MSEVETFGREQERESGTKIFNIPSYQLKGYSTIQKYNKNREFKEAQEMQQQCLLLAKSYAHVMVKRLLNEKPDYFEETGHNADSFKTHLANNFCIRETQNQAVAFRKTHADMIEDEYTKESMRRMINGGDRFHPYM